MTNILNIADTIPQPVALKDIDDSPGPCCMSFGFDLTPLIQSIENVDLINPPILRKDNQGNITIIAGYRRIKAMKSLKRGRAACRILSGRDISPLKCLQLNLYDNLSIRTLNQVEKAMILTRLSSLVSRDETMAYYMPLLGLPSNEETLLFFLRVERDLGKTEKEFLAQGRLSLQATKMLLEVDEASRSAILGFLSDIKLNTNQQTQYIDYLIDLAHIECKSIPQILGEKVLTGICSDTHMNGPQKGRAILRNLRARRNPSLVSAEKRFNKTLSGLNLPVGVQVNAPPYFEGTDYRLEVLFKEGKDLRKKLQVLYQSEGLSNLGNPWGKKS
ncbi:MAG: ParB N-terminal domain-containing protein [Pseudomonadota bacterium]|jgi:ParB-like chromosome segregation protein Spo0J